MVVPLIPLALSGAVGAGGTYEFLRQRKALEQSVADLAEERRRKEEEQKNLAETQAQEAIDEAAKQLEREQAAKQKTEKGKKRVLGSIGPVPPKKPEPSFSEKTYQFMTSPIMNVVSDIFAGMGQGKTPQESLKFAAQSVSSGQQARVKQYLAESMFKDMGFSDIQARGMAQNPELVKTIFDYRAKSEAAAKKGDMMTVVTPGGGRMQVPEFLSDKMFEIKRERDAALNRIRSMTDQRDLILDKVKGLRERVLRHGRDVVGGNLTRAARMSHGGVASDFLTLHRELTAQMTLDKIQQMKDASKSGTVGLGQVSIPEFMALSNAIRALDVSQSPELYLQQLSKIEALAKRVYGQVKHEREFVDLSNLSLERSIRSSGRSAAEQEFFIKDWNITLPGQQPQQQQAPRQVMYNNEPATVVSSMDDPIIKSLAKGTLLVIDQPGPDGMRPVFRKD